MPALLPHRGQGLHLRVVGHSTSGGIALLVLLELLLSPPLGLGGHGGSLRDGFQSIRALGFGSPLAIASLSPPPLPPVKPSGAHDAKPPLSPQKASAPTAVRTQKNTKEHKRTQKNTKAIPSGAGARAGAGAGLDCDHCCTSRRVVRASTRRHNLISREVAERLPAFPGRWLDAAACG